MQLCKVRRRALPPSKGSNLGCQDLHPLALDSFRDLWLPGRADSEYDVFCKSSWHFRRQCQISGTDPNVPCPTHKRALRQVDGSRTHAPRRNRRWAIDFGRLQFKVLPYTLRCCFFNVYESTNTTAIDCHRDCPCHRTTGRPNCGPPLGYATGESIWVLYVSARNYLLLCICILRPILRSKAGIAGVTFYWHRNSVQSLFPGAPNSIHLASHRHHNHRRIHCRDLVLGRRSTSEAEARRLTSLRNSVR